MSASVAIALGWTVVAAATLALDVAMLAAVLGNWRALRRRRANGARGLVARMAVRRRVARVVVQVLFLAIGVAALVAPAPPRRQRPADIVLALGLIATEALLATTTVVDRRDQRRLLEELERHENRGIE